MKPTQWIWKNGELISWESATTHVLTHALHYGTGVFEGIRAYETVNGPAIFRAEEHYIRLLDSAKIYRMPMQWTPAQLIEATQQVIQANHLKSCYIRPLAYYGYGVMGLDPRKNPIDTIIAVWEWGTYLGDEGLERGIKTKVCSWARIDSRVLPSLAKCTANYANSILAKQEALDAGCEEGILLNLQGAVAEGPGENIFVIRNGVIATPPSSENVLQGITAQSIVEIARDLGYTVDYRRVAREELYIADELFFTGTAAEVTPIREVDGRQVGIGSRGPITAQLQSAFFDIVKGKNPKYNHWLTTVQTTVAK